MTTINPYLTFNGNCEEAFSFYQSIFGGEIPYAGKFKDMPENAECQVSEEDKEKIMHISLPISKETILMGSDRTGADQFVEGNNFSISISTDLEEEAVRIFNALSEDGTIDMPLNKTFWGSYFGMLTDKFNIKWMVSAQLKE
ncbi:VOC family protein [Candidatus Uabimicrobium sp. HlEnr_7]|uniref:VOC family protein n=1 Tax=Candidatus Uabimicrobium helgolandensis TaxID=3095367 RepID=UPI003556BA71